jgi:hypothetical protein
MPTEGLAMHHVRDVIRLKSAGMPIRQIARRIGGGAFNRPAADPPVRGGGPDLGGRTSRMREARLFAGAGTKQGHRRRAVPD